MTPANVVLLTDYALDQKALADFRSNPPAFLLVSAKRKTK